MNRRKIAILGGGASSLFAAWKLLEADPGGYDLTVYQVGWRLGGKGASGRRMDSGTDRRIEEHGLHFMFGFYANVFAVTQAAYRAAYPGEPAMWNRFFRSDDTAITMIHFTNEAAGQWEPWPVPNPQGYTAPQGDANDQNTVALVLENFWRWIKEVVRGAAAGHGPETLLGLDRGPRTATRPEPTSLALDRAAIDGLTPPRAPRPEATDDFDAAAILRSTLEPSYWDLGRDFVHHLRQQLAGEPPEEPDADAERHDRLLDYSFDVIDRLYESATGDDADEARSRWAAIRGIASFVTTVAKGLAKDLLLRPDTNWFSLDTLDFKEWIAKHGGDPNSPPVRGLYDAVFSTYKPLGAGSILQAFTKAAFLFEGGFLFKMHAGMGDAIFTPLYLALKERGVTFEFFHRVENLALSSDGNTVDSIELERQVALEGSYDPLIDVEVDIGGPMTLKCWPSEPLWERLPSAEVSRIRGKLNLENGWTPRTGQTVTLRRGVEFDDVILGISVAGLPDVCPELLAADPRLREHVDALVMNTTATQGLQLWTAPGSVPEQPSPVIVPYTEPYDTIADMSHLLDAEAWQGEKPATLYYLCSAIEEKGLHSLPLRSDLGYFPALEAKAESESATWCTRDAPGLWRNLYPEGRFDWNTLHAPAGAEGVERLRAQFLSTTVNLSDRYVIPGPNSFAKRLKSNETRFTNLYLTGDWIKTSLSIGCLEAAAMSGVQAARAVAMECGRAEVRRPLNDWIEDVTPRPRPRSAAGTFVRRDGALMAQPPYAVEMHDVFLFVVEADRSALQALCDRELNLGPRRYAPLGDFVVFYGARIGNRSNDTILRSRELGVWVPLVADAGDGDRELLTYSPYVWLDSSTSMHVGREVFGYPKLVGDVRLPQEGDARVLEAFGDALATRGAEATVQRDLLVRIESDEAGGWERSATSGPQRWVDLAQLLAEVAKELVEISPKPSVRELAALGGGMRSVFLKQLPGSGTSTEADFQALVLASVVPDPSTLCGDPLSGRWTLTLPDGYDEPRIAENLGLRGGTRLGTGATSSYQVRARTQAWMQFAGTLTAGEEIWRAR